MQTNFEQYSIPHTHTHTRTLVCKPCWQKQQEDIRPFWLQGHCTDLQKNGQLPQFFSQNLAPAARSRTKINYSLDICNNTTK